MILGFAIVADVTKLAFIIGAFMAGLALGRVEGHQRIVSDLSAVGKILMPVFFVSIGIATDLEAMFKPSVLGLAAGLFVVAVLGKLVAAYGVGRLAVDKLTIGIGMVPRGEVGLIFASIGLANGVLDAEAYGALLLVLLLSTVMTPPWLRVRVKQVRRANPTPVAAA
jgi:Kef-type K+ transport system membrane component KefB